MSPPATARPVDRRVAADAVQLAIFLIKDRIVVSVCRPRRPWQAADCTIGERDQVDAEKLGSALDLCFRSWIPVQRLLEGLRDRSTFSSASPNSGGAILRIRARMLKTTVERNTSGRREGGLGESRVQAVRTCSVVGPLDYGNSVGKLLSAVFSALVAEGKLPLHAADDELQNLHSVGA